MGTDSRIEWTDHTFNPWLGCTKITPGCDRCYAESWSKRSGLVKWGNSPRRRTSPGYSQQPMRSRCCNFLEKRNGRRQRFFVPRWLTCSIIKPKRRGASSSSH